MQNLHLCTRNFSQQSIQIVSKTLDQCSQMFCDCLKNKLLMEMYNDPTKSMQCVQNLDYLCLPLLQKNGN